MWYLAGLYETESPRFTERLWHKRSDGKPVKEDIQMLNSALHTHKHTCIHMSTHTYTMYEKQNDL